MLLGIDDGAWLFGGVVLTQLTVVFGMVYAGHNAKKARAMAESTNIAVNHVAEGEPTLVEQVRMNRATLKKHGRYHEWQATVLREVAHQAGVFVPPFPTDDEEEAA